MRRLLHYVRAVQAPGGADHKEQVQGSSLCLCHVVVEAYEWLKESV